MVNDENQEFCEPDALDLLEKLLVYDHVGTRLTFRLVG